MIPGLSCRSKPPSAARLEVSESSTSLPGESHADATDADASVLANYPHSRAAWIILKGDYLVRKGSPA
jgi:hypothetical protein